jgi:hypothetical protein
MVYNYEPLAYGAWGMGLWLDQAGSMPYRVVVIRKLYLSAWLAMYRILHGITMQ